MSASQPQAGEPVRIAIAMKHDGFRLAVEHRLDLDAAAVVDTVERDARGVITGI